MIWIYSRRVNNFRKMNKESKSKKRKSKNSPIPETTQDLRLKATWWSKIQSSHQWLLSSKWKQVLHKSKLPLRIGKSIEIRKEGVQVIHRKREAVLSLTRYVLTLRWALSSISWTWCQIWAKFMVLTKAASWKGLVPPRMPKVSPH